MCNTYAVLLAGFNEVPEALWVIVVDRQHVVCIAVMCISTLVNVYVDLVVFTRIAGTS